MLLSKKGLSHRALGLLPAAESAERTESATITFTTQSGRSDTSCLMIIGQCMWQARHRFLAAEHVSCFTMLNHNRTSSSLPKLHLTSRAGHSLWAKLHHGEKKIC